MVLKMEGISKEYFGNTVLKNVNINIKKGEIHALLGENGAGKSTLMNILFGMNVIHSTGGYNGKVYIDDKEVLIDNPQKAMELGIGMVHQEFMLIPGFSVTENIKIGREITKKNVFSNLISKQLEVLDMKTMNIEAKDSLDTVGLSISEYAKVAGMPVGYMQFIEIAREIDKTGVKILVFDEPTAVLTESEAERLLETMVNITKTGISIIFITHRLDEVMAVSDNITILRDGELVGTRKKTETNKVELAELMIGRKITRYVSEETEARKMNTNPVLTLKDFHVHYEGEEVKGVDLEVYEGEILGIGGLAGQGKIGIFNGLMSMTESSGQVTLFGETFTLNRLGEALRKGVAFVSEDRRGVGLLLNESIAQNIAFNSTQINKSFLFHLGPFTYLNKSAMKRHAEQLIKELDIRCTGSSQHVGSLSGGNQQKVCLASALTLNPKLLIVAEPTRGIDIGAKKLVLDKLININRTKKTTIIIVSSELAELRSVCDRIAIISDGKVASILKPDASDAAFGLAMSGESGEDVA